ncbi:MAG TPA: LPS export ABC transporter periplasmic protein LptC [Bacteroidales bacterium]|mgnify:CR=1 FL=1|nr:MAG: Lipopolysaccharide-assembly, LptC-related [Bacteroidetes bacterium ADurb.Bin037]HPV88276.1 LPS export ABC transporter periplasmic protein LptC [Bacteroidales bacterium]HPW78036.1 LPS export ABC transporter periplasmic protein LptC [Bacteroidales bacterium]HQB55272.1 LPS export ABC transporter periplasmic protein LptC [Bacteroidales bacterium]
MGFISRTTTGVMVAMGLSVATIFVSCKNRVTTIESLQNLDSIPTQIIENMEGWQVEGGVLRGRLTAPYMEKYTRGSDPYEIFPHAFRVEAYTPEGDLETIITADRAMHRTGEEQIWIATGNVIIRNLLKEETVETDTLYWDQQQKTIYTHCYVRLTSPDFFAQGYGMESDERAANAKILRPFDSYGYIKQDTLSNEEKELTSRSDIQPQQ